jgi:hypothetical protein
MISGMIRRVLVLLAFAVASAHAQAPSLLEHNTPAARARLVRREKFAPVYTAVEERDGSPTEIMALRVLLDDPAIELASKRLRQSVDGFGQPGTAARLAAAEQELARWIRAEAAKPEFARAWLSYAGPGGQKDPDWMIFTTPHAAIARLYGEVVFEVREETPRGVDLNALNREVFRFYDALPLRERLKPRGALIRGVLDRDEYVIPSHVPRGDVAAVEVRARLPQWLRTDSVQLSGRVQRRYTRDRAGAVRWVDLTDRKGAWIARFSLDPAAPRPEGPRSGAELPADVEAAVRGMRVGGRSVIVLR